MKGVAVAIMALVQVKKACYDSSMQIPTHY